LEKTMMGARLLPFSASTSSSRADAFAAGKHAVNQQPAITDKNHTPPENNDTALFM
jgi:hypothetical protein